MAKSDIQTYYYFRIRNGVEYAIKESPFQINTSIMHTFYRELTAEQREFFLANPTATVREIVQCQLTPPYVPPAPDLQKYILNKIKELREACYASITVTKLECDMALDKLVNIAGDSYYDIADAKQVLYNFRLQSKNAMQVYDTYKTQIEAARTIKAVDALYDQAIAAL